MRAFYEPTQEHLTKLSLPWCASFSGGKDSSSLVTWAEWLRRVSWIDVPTPHLVRSDTCVEESGLADVAEELTALLAACGWECKTVRPEVHERLYPQILGRGLPPIHPGVRRMRWCTRSTKIDPMDRHKDEIGGGRLWITGLRLGESAMRDGKLKKSTCAAGGECGIPEPGEGRYSPLLKWQTCHVIDWLNGAVAAEVRKVMGDVFALTSRLVGIYGVRHGQPTFADYGEEEIKADRFGCVGCPAIGAGAAAPRTVKRRYGESPLLELYDVWHEARLPKNRLVLIRDGRPKMGPVTVEARKRLFARVMDIQRRAGVVLVTPEDEAFIRQCWEESVYPRGSSAADEATVFPMPLYD